MGGSREAERGGAADEDRCSEQSEAGRPSRYLLERHSGAGGGAVETRWQSGVDGGEGSSKEAPVCCHSPGGQGAGWSEGRPNTQDGIPNRTCGWNPW